MCLSGTISPNLRFQYSSTKQLTLVFGIPGELVADNMPFGSQAVQMFAQEWGSKLSYNDNLSANGLGERNIEPSNSRFRKADQSSPPTPS